MLRTPYIVYSPHEVQYVLDYMPFLWHLGGFHEECLNCNYQRMFGVPSLDAFNSKLLVELH